MNEIVYMLQNYNLGSGDSVLMAVEGVFGLKFKEAYKNYGYEAIRESLQENYDKSLQELYVAFEKEAYDKVFG